MNNQNVDVLVFPTWSNPPRLIGDYYSCDGEHGILRVVLLGSLPAACDRVCRSKGLTQPQPAQAAPPVILPRPASWHALEMVKCACCRE